MGLFALAPVAHADTNTTIYPYTGSEQTFVVPSGVNSVHVGAVGGQGGTTTSTFGNTTRGGLGAAVTADLAVTPGQTLYVEVGGNGRDGSGPSSNGAGGWNGGGAGIYYNGAGGGGGSDVRTVPSGNGGSLDSRLTVAGGGGGAAGEATGGDSAESGSPGASDNNPFCDPGGPGAGGTQISGGSGGSASPGVIAGGFRNGRGGDGSSGAGGNGGGAGNGLIGGGAGGGGGYYGGGGGGAGQNCGGGGGGGSSFVTSNTTSASYGTDSSGIPKITIGYLVPQAPMATTEPASDVGQSGATLNGVLNAGGYATSYFFQYGTSANYGAETMQQDAGSGTGNKSVSALLSSLNSSTTYHFQLVATNASGTTYGGDRTFTTAAVPPALAPMATTEPASDVRWHVATLNGVVNPEGSATTYVFRYGRTTAYGAHTARLSAGSGTTNEGVQAQLSGLRRFTTYHFRLIATSSVGTTYGRDRTFRTR